MANGGKMGGAYQGNYRGSKRGGNRGGKKWLNDFIQLTLVLINHYSELNFILVLFVLLLLVILFCCSSSCINAVATLSNINILRDVDLAYLRVIWQCVSVRGSINLIGGRTLSFDLWNNLIERPRVSCWHSRQGRHRWRKFGCWSLCWSCLRIFC
jgi:hypothetical protein